MWNHSKDHQLDSPEFQTQKSWFFTERLVWTAAAAVLSLRLSFQDGDVGSYFSVAPPLSGAVWELTLGQENRFLSGSNSLLV